MKTLNLHKLFNAARQDTAPAVDVADAVLAQLAGDRRSVGAATDRFLVWASMASTAVAAGVVLAALWVWQHNADSVNELINMVAWAAQ